MLFALLALGCTTYEETEYDVPARDRVRTVRLEIEPDGAPLILAQVDMYYTTTAPLREWDARYQHRNVRSMAYSRRDGAWKAHSFRNLQSPYSESSALLRSGKGEVLPLIWDMHRLALYGRSGSDWSVRKTAKVDGYQSWNSIGDIAGGGTAVIPAGDSAWQALNYVYASNLPPSLEMLRCDGSRFRFDSAVSFSSIVMLPGTEENMLVGITWPQYGQAQGQGEVPKLQCYRWSLDPLAPNLRKQVLPMDLPIWPNTLASAVVLGEQRLYGLADENHLAEYALREGEFVFLGYRLLASRAEAGPTKGSGPSHRYGAVVDPLDCLHDLTALSPDSLNPMPTAYVHTSSCENGVDTLKLPAPVAQPLSISLSDLRFAGDGTAMISAALYQFSRLGSDLDLIAPSWIYLARRPPGGKWEWEKVAEF